MLQILIIDDDKNIRRYLKTILLASRVHSNLHGNSR